MMMKGLILYECMYVCKYVCEYILTTGGDFLSLLGLLDHALGDAVLITTGRLLYTYIHDT